MHAVGENCAHMPTDSDVAYSFKIIMYTRQ